MQTERRAIALVVSIATVAGTTCNGKTSSFSTAILARTQQETLNSFVRLHFV